MSVTIMPLERRNEQIVRNVHRDRAAIKRMAKKFGLAEKTTYFIYLDHRDEVLGKRGGQRASTRKRHRAA